MGIVRKDERFFLTLKLFMNFRTTRWLVSSLAGNIYISLFWGRFSGLKV